MPSLWRQVRAIGPFPVVVTVVIPAAALWVSVRANWFPPRPGLGLPAVAGLAVELAGGLVAVAGLLLWVVAVGLFATIGEGTLIPWDEPRRLVLHGPYRYVRNPMIGGVLMVLLGEAVGFGSLPVLLWFVLFLALQTAVIRLWEEPHLARIYGQDYLNYRRHVRRWVPRLRPWRPGARHPSRPG